MKTIRCAALALLAGTPALWAAPRLFVTTPTLAPESGVELILDRAVVPDETVGKTTPNDWLSINPALPGKLSWKAPNVARFLPDQAPAIGTAYKFAVVPGRKHLDQSPVPAGAVNEISSEPFGLNSPNILNRYSDDFSPRTAAFLLEFNDDVDPAAVAAFFSFENNSHQRVAATAARPTAEQLERNRYRRPSWAQRFEQAKAQRDGKEDVTPTTAANNLLVVTPITPLPTGKDWRLSILAGLPNATRSTTLSEATSAMLGDIQPLSVTGIAANVVANEAPVISVGFSTKLPERIPAEVLKASLKIEPEVPGMRVETQSNHLTIHGDFSSQENWLVTLSEPLTSKDGRVLAKPVTQQLYFNPLPPSIALPTDAQSQLANGGRTYRIETVNLSSVRVRVKQLDAVSLVRTFQGFRHYTGDGPNEQGFSPTHLLPYEMVFGATVVDREFPIEGGLNTSKVLTLEWDKLLPNTPKNASLFVDVTGTPRIGSSDTEQPSPNGPSQKLEEGSEKRAVAQACLQLTDIGIAWKLTKDSAQVFAFSCNTGEPLQGVTLETYGEDAKLLGSRTTDARGLVTFARPQELRHLRARLNDDTYITAFDEQLETVGIWRFPVEYSWSPPPATQRRVFVFTDRSLYRPGETVHLKGIVRAQTGNDVKNPAEEKCHLIIRNPQDEVVRDEAITLSSNGSFDFSFDAPDGITGHYNAVFEYTDDIARAEALPEDNYEEKETLTSNARFEFPIRVEEFRRNAFETEAKLAEAAPGATNLTASLQANYYQGQPVAAGGVKHYTHISDTNFYPERFRDYLFGNHRNTDYYYWSYYFGYSGGDDEEESDSGLPGHTVNGETNLTAEGKVTVPITLTNSEFPSAKKVSLRAEITDANHQTLNAAADTIVHPAQIYLGISRTDRLVRVGDRIPLSIVATSTKGEPWQGDVSVETEISREVNDTTKVESGSGSAVNNESREETLSNGKLTVAGADNSSRGTTFEFAPTKPGLHYITLRGKDAEGHPFATATSLHVYGTNEFPWAYEDGMRIKLVPEKKSYQAGETARVLVLSPIEGKALVTIERDKVLRSQIVELKSDNPVLELPVGDDDAPNVFVSVLVIKGARASAREHKEPQLRLGYCTLRVQSPRHRLSVDMKLQGDDATPATQTLPVSYRPGGEVEVAGTVTGGDGAPAANAEVTLYAEDEGTLAVMGYKNPDPFGYFYKIRQLLVGTGTSLGNFMSEDPEVQSFTNKGFFIGGGGDFADAAGLLRKEFNPCAAWLPKLTTDANGRFTAKFKLPDTLTRYRLIAVAHQGAEKFGTAQSAFVANKSLMLEVKAPRFANESDRVNPQVLVQNASEWAGTWTIRYAPHDGPNTPVCRALDETERTVTLDAGASQVVVFPTLAETTGTATLTFRAEPVSLRGATLTPQLGRKLSDAVQAKFEVSYPMPLLRDHRMVKLPPNGETNLFKGVDPALIEGRGDIELELSRSPLLGAGDSVDFLLQYPYGCVEQTSSATMPWLAIDALRPHLPGLSKYTPEQTRKALQAGVNRLLSMQLAGGGFSYWPGNGERVDWASSYAGLVLVLASQQEGIHVPESAIANVTNDLTASLRGIAQLKSPYQLEIAARGLWILALAEKPQEAYHNLLLDRLNQLTPRARAYLALAIHEADEGNTPRAIEVLRSKKAFAGKYDGWMTYEADDAIELLAWATIDPNAPECTASIDRLMHERDPYRGWHTTWANSWSLLAIATYAETTDTDGQSVMVALDNAATQETVELTTDQPTQSRKIPLASGMKLTATAPHAVFARVKIAAKPKIAPTQPVATNGLEVTRFYERVKPDGTSEPLDKAKVGDLIRVSLRVTNPTDNSRYVVVEDPLPPMFETVNQDFASQSSVKGGTTSQDAWNVSHSELRGDRAVFFFDRIWQRGSYTLTYLVRCTMAGDGTAPAAKVEGMYAPQNVAFSASRRFEVTQ